MPAMQDPFGQMWKEYAYSDSRYMTSDAFVLCMESVTAVSSSNPKVSSQVLIQSGRLYGDRLAMSLFG